MGHQLLPQKVTKGQTINTQCDIVICKTSHSIGETSCTWSVCLIKGTESLGESTTIDYNPIQGLNESRLGFLLLLLSPSVNINSVWCDLNTSQIQQRRTRSKGCRRLLGCKWQVRGLSLSFLPLVHIWIMKPNHGGIIKSNLCHSYRFSASLHQEVGTRSRSRVGPRSRSWTG